MSDDPRFKKRLYTSAVALGLAVGSVGIAAATTDTSTPPAPEDAAEVQEPAYTRSVQAPNEDESLTETEESAQLDGLATITADEAASAAVPGDVAQVELDIENGSVVYSVEVTDATGGETEAKVDAGNGTILDQQGDDDEADDDVHNENDHED